LLPLLLLLLLLQKRTRKELEQQGVSLPALGFTSRGTFEVPR
jgi:hypothetical protein